MRPGRAKDQNLRPKPHVIPIGFGFRIIYEGFPKITGTFWWFPVIKDCRALGSTLGSLHFENLPYNAYITTVMVEVNRWSTLEPLRIALRFLEGPFCWL